MYWTNDWYFFISGEKGSLLSVKNSSETKKSTNAETEDQRERERERERERGREMGTDASCAFFRSFVCKAWWHIHVFL